MPQFDPNADQTRTYSVPATADTDKREISGIGVPLETPTTLWRGLREEFAQDCVFEGIETAKLKRSHAQLIGVIASHERAAGRLNVRAKVSQIAPGDEALTLARDGALDSFSIGFRTVSYTETVDDATNTLTIRHTHVKVREFSLTDNPQYTEAAVTEVREAAPAAPEGEQPMPETLTREEFDTLTHERDEALTRKLETLVASSAQNRESATLGDQWRSVGDFMKALASGDEAAMDFHRDYTGGVLADGAPKAAWIADAIKLVDRPRKIINRFGRQALPAEGDVLSWYQLKSDTMTVDKQAAEGDDLPFGKVQLEPKTTQIGTYGGAGGVSRQAAERSTAPLLSTAHRALAFAYARRTEAAARAFFYKVLLDQATAGNKLERPVDLATMDAGDWLDLIVDGSQVMDDRGFGLERMGVSKDVFKLLYRLEDTAGNRIMNVFGTGINQVGSINAKGARGVLANVEVDILPGSPANTIEFDASEAIDTFESPGAPIQLQDENIINLTKVFSVYGYAAWANPFPGAVLPVVAAG